MNILIVIDMQNDFITGSLGTAEAQAVLPKVVEKIKTFEGELVIATQDTHFTDYARTLEGERLPVKHCIKNTPGWCLCPEVFDALDDQLNVDCVEKPTFGSIDLIAKLKKLKSVECIEICGVCTDICVVSNALLLRANFPNVQIIVDSACCAGTTPEAHEAALTVMKSCQIDVVENVNQWANNGSYDSSEIYSEEI